jgi:hypothetical protein
MVAQLPVEEKVAGSTPVESAFCIMAGCHTKTKRSKGPIKPSIIKLIIEDIRPRQRLVKTNLGLLLLR